MTEPTKEMLEAAEQLLREQVDRNAEERRRTYAARREVERLRAEKAETARRSTEVHRLRGNDHAEVAKMLWEAQRERDAARKEHQDMVEKWKADMCTALDERDAARQKNERLREALEQWHDYLEPDPDDKHTCIFNDCFDCVNERENQSTRKCIMDLLTEAPTAGSDTGDGEP